MLATLLSVVAVALALLLVAIATRPGSFLLRRAAVIDAPAEVIFAQVADLRRWAAWNPFQKADPHARVTYAGADGSVGSSYHFAGKKMGEGRMTLTEIAPHERVLVEARFIKPFAATNTIEFTLTPAADGVRVTWSMYGKQTFLGKALSLFMSMDGMMGKEFEAGLAELKRVAEVEAERAWAGRSGAAV